MRGAILYSSGNKKIVRGVLFFFRYSGALYDIKLRLDDQITIPVNVFPDIIYHHNFYTAMKIPGVV
jgi:hypothetical protein